MNSTRIMSAWNAQNMTRYFYWICYAVMGALLSADQYVKHLIVERFDYAERLIVNDFFSLILVFNRGAAFSFLSDASGWQRWFLTVVSLGASVVLIVLIYQKRSERFVSLMLAFIGAGALGNLIDRVRDGHVIDFLLFHWQSWYWPAFNLADTWITIGVSGIVLNEIYLMKWGQTLRSPIE